MNFAQQATAVSAVILLIDYLFGVTFGVFGSMVFGSVRENHRMSLLQSAPDPVSAGARVILGVSRRDGDGYMGSLPPGQRGTAREPRGNGSPGSHGQGLDR